MNVDSAGLAKALLAAQKEMPQLHKDAKADTGKFSYSYLSLQTLLSEVLPVLNKHGLVLVQAPTLVDGVPCLRTAIIHESGDREWADMPLAAGLDASAQSQGSAITYARRYALMAVLGLAADEDDDGAAAQGAKRKAQTNGNEPMATQAQHAKHNAMLGELADRDPKAEGQLSWEDDARNYVKEHFGKSSRSQLTKKEMDGLIAWTQSRVDAIGIPFA